LLALTNNAVDAVKEIISSSDETAETGGLRLVAQQTGMQPRRPTRSLLDDDRRGHPPRAAFDARGAADVPAPGAEHGSASVC
jgi:hypothetical protein